MWPSSDRASPQPPAGRAVPSLGPFAELLGQPYQRLKVAVLRQLAGLAAVSNFSRKIVAKKSFVVVIPFDPPTATTGMRRS